MAATGDLIDFEIIESSKENIQSLPSGRSAKSLAQILSPVASQRSPAHTQDIHDAARQEFENEINKIDESDDPLDVYDRYVKWTLSTYPSAQATPQSQLLPILERATKAFLSSTHYKNDPRYMRIWLHYIRFFSDAPRETFAYLARHGVGAELALFYEEFAAWLEGAGRWNQAEEVFKLGLEKDARPTERLMRKFGEFEKRKEARPQDVQEPSSPALPTVRPALAAKLDPFASSDSPITQQDSQAGRAHPTGKKNKLAIFADDGKQEAPAANGAAKGWNDMGTLAERKKENAVGPTSWTGETMKSGADKATMPAKMMIFKDPSISRVPMPLPVSNHPIFDQRVKNPRTGRYECVAVDLESLYPDPEDPTVELCFEELMLARRGELQWNRSARSLAREPLAPSPRKALDNASNIVSMPASHAPKTISLNDVNDENAPAHVGSPPQKHKSAKKHRKADKDNKTRKITMREVRGETQTIQTNFDSPQGGRVKRKKSHEPTMTLHTKEAQDEMYDIFSAPLASEQTQTTVDIGSDSSGSDETSDEDDDYTSAGESTGTGRLSAGTSEYGDETKGDLEEGPDAADESEPTATNTGWTDFDTRRDVPGREESGAEDGEPHDQGTERNEDVVTPTSPTDPAAAEGRQTMFIPLPPADYEQPRNPYRDPEQVARNRLPFMTPIVEKTESSLGAATGHRDGDNLTMKTPCPKGEQKLLDIDDGPASSPFQALLEEAAAADEDQRPIPPPKLEKIETKTLAERAVASRQLSTTASAITPAPLPKKEIASLSTASKGPIIKDKQCNPMDEHIRTTILQEMHPPLSTFKGYFPHPGQSSGRRGEIKKYCKSLKGNHTLGEPPVLTLDGAERSLVIKRELGAGAYAPVYLAEPVEDESEPTTTTSDLVPAARGRLEAIKMEDPPSPWEFYILRAAKRRLGVSRAADSIVDVFEYHAFADECYLIEEYRNQGTLLDLVNASVREHAAANGPGTGPAALEEPLAMFFAVELLRTVEALHSKGIVHGDLKADNVLVRLDDTLAVSGRPELDAHYHKDGSGGWTAKGVALIDFGRGIDMRAFRNDVSFVADWPVGETDCAEMREMRPWTFQADYHGVAGVLHTLLFGRYIETVAERGGGVGPGAAKTWRIRESLKRYWQTEIWSDAFALLLNSGRMCESEEGNRLPALRGLRGVREKMEAWLEENGERGVGLKTLMRRAEGLVNARKR